MCKFLVCTSCKFASFVSSFNIIYTPSQIYTYSIGMIKALKDFATYESFAYHISLLRQFVSIHSRNNNSKDDGSSSPVVSSVHGNNVFASLRKKRGLGASTTKGENEPDDSGRSAKSMSMGGMRRVNTSTGRLSAMS